MHERQIKIFQRMTAEQKLIVSSRLYYSVWELKESALKKAHPDWMSDKIYKEVRKLFLHART